MKSDCCVVQLPSCLWLFVTSWTAARQASTSLTISWSLPKFMSISDGIRKHVKKKMSRSLSPLCAHFCLLFNKHLSQTVKHLPAMQETWVLSLGREDTLEKKMTAHSSTLTWKILRTEEPGRLQSKGSQRVRHNWATSLHLVDKCRAYWL